MNKYRCPRYNECEHREGKEIQVCNMDIFYICYWFDHGRDKRNHNFEEHLTPEELERFRRSQR